jgi:hypothetical protein
MSTRSCRSARALALAAMAVVAGVGHSRALRVDALDDGRDLAVADSHRPTVEAAFPYESYRPGTIARLVISHDQRRLAIVVRLAA